MRYEIRGSNHVRACTISERKVRLPNCFKGLGKYEASPGDFVTFKQMQGDDTYDTRIGRVLGRVDAPFVPSSDGNPLHDCSKVEGWLAVLVLGDNARHALVGTRTDSEGDPAEAENA